MNLQYSTVSFLSDYGLVDEFVGVVKSVIRALAPDAVVIDISHEVPPHDIRAGGLTLARSAQYLAPGVVLAVVDPGVGTHRRAVAVEVGDGESVLVGPDNGLLAPAVAMVGGATRAVELTNSELHLPAPGPTFAGRDVFAPAAAHLCTGTPFIELGSEIDPASLVPGILPIARPEGNGLAAEVLWVDRFGNVQLNVDPDDVDDWGERIRLRLGDEVRTARRDSTYDEIATGEVGLVVDSYGLLSIAVPRGSAAAVFRLDAGAAVTLERLDDDESDDAAGTTTRDTTTDVQLRPRVPR
ncbi:MAG: SAM hydrolase/SAM-dependent halogenase family protein [Acidimicrobiales bacterium]